MWILISLGIIGVILYNFFTDQDKMLKEQVDLQGGMSKKYEYLVNYLTKYPSARVIKVTRDHIHIQAKGDTSSISFLITESFGFVEIEWIAHLGMLGTHKHRWSFSKEVSQEKMIKQIVEDTQSKTQQIFGNKL